MSGLLSFWLGTMLVWFHYDRFVPLPRRIWRAAMWLPSYLRSLLEALTYRVRK